MDRDGNLLAYNELAYSVTIEDVYESGRKKNANLNNTIRRLIAMIEKSGDHVISDFHIEIDRNGEYAYNVEGTQLLRFLADVYLFEWTGRRFYLYIWVSLPFFIFVLKDFVAAWIITIGNLAGVVIGQLWGDYLIYINSFKITPEMDAEMVYHLQYHYGAFIWLFIILACFILCFGYKQFKRARRVWREIEEQYGDTAV